MVDDATWAGILKTDGRGRDLVGAVLQVKDKSGNVIEEWTTDGTRHEMRAVLNPDETYILHEVSAPEDISFPRILNSLPDSVSSWRTSSRQI